MSMKPRIFIGSGEASLLERKTLIHTLRKNSSVDVDIYVFNGTHNSVEHEDDEPYLAPMSLKVKYANVTEFSNYRFLIPQLCNHEGLALFMDSDILALGDIAELFNTPLNGKQFICKGDAYDKLGEKRWGLSVCLMDCSKTRFDLELYFQEIEQGLYTYTDLHQMSPKFLAIHPFDIGELDSKWNDFDHADADTKNIHYTGLSTQPWKFPGHKFEDLWFRYFNEAREAGLVTDRDIELSQHRAYCRQDITNPQNPKAKKPPERVYVQDAARIFAKALRDKFLGVKA